MQCHHNKRCATVCHSIRGGGQLKSRRAVGVMYLSQCGPSWRAQGGPSILVHGRPLPRPVAASSRPPRSSDFNLPPSSDFTAFAYVPTLAGLIFRREPTPKLLPIPYHDLFGCSFCYPNFPRPINACLPPGFDSTALHHGSSASSP